MFFTFVSELPDHSAGVNVLITAAGRLHVPVWPTVSHWTGTGWNPNVPLRVRITITGTIRIGNLLPVPILRRAISVFLGRSSRRVSASHVAPLIAAIRGKSGLRGFGINDGCG